ncbi:TPA: hypothetical protein P0E05_000163 [Vibrio fluvialis]|nr:hypothetical protein [Vibrio fluvialis]
MTDNDTNRIVTSTLNCAVSVFCCEDKFASDMNFASLIFGNGNAQCIDMAKQKWKKPLMTQRLFECGGEIGI